MVARRAGVPRGGLQLHFVGLPIGSGKESCCPGELAGPLVRFFRGLPQIAESTGRLGRFLLSGCGHQRAVVNRAVEAKFSVHGGEQPAARFHGEDSLDCSEKHVGVQGITAQELINCQDTFSRGLKTLQ